MNSYDGKLFYVTGGSSGIGLEIAREAAAQGASVWLIARRESVLLTALERVKLSAVRPSQRFGTLSVDLGDSQQVFPAFERAIEESGVPDVLVNSAGAAHPGYVQELDPSIFRWMMDANYFSTVYACKAVLPGMIARRSGYIINISSVAGFMGIFGYSAYGASKFAVAGFTEALRAEMKPHGIGVSIAWPSDTHTPQLEYENRFKPPETRAISGNVAVQSAEQVARSILRQAAQNRYAIFSSFDARLAYLLYNLLPKRLTFALLDKMAAQAKRQ